MKKADKVAYDKDYAASKKDGKPFFPYAIYKDTIIAGQPGVDRLPPAP
jgi:hypothetical protein